MGAGVLAKGSGGSSRRRGRRSLRRRKPMSDINVTPFVDVMLVLLVIFMVAAPLMTVGVPVRLPETAATALPAEQQEPLSVTLTADGRILVQTTEVERDALIPMLRAVQAERRDDKIFLRADGAIAYEAVMQVMGALNAGGFRNIGLVTEPGGPRLDGRGG